MTDLTDADGFLMATLFCSKDPIPTGAAASARCQFCHRRPRQIRKSIEAISVLPTLEGVTPFQIEVDEEIVDDVRRRLAAERWPDAVSDAGWNYGTPIAYLKELRDYWL